MGSYSRAVSTDLQALFREAMSVLASGVAVLTARRGDGRPCGLAATSLTSYSAHPPSLLVSVWHGSRCHGALEASRHFGVHLLRADELDLAQRFANRDLANKFDGLDWSWDDDVPELAGTLAYLRLRRAANFVRYDHTLLIGDLEGGRLEDGEPLVYARRRMDWLMRPMR
jgi:flavin reductase ActVB